MKDTFAARPWNLVEILLLMLWAGIAFLTWSFMHNADHFLELTPEALGKYFDFRWILILHITAGGGALIMGPFQFWERLRNNNWRLHRTVGVLYLLAIAASGFCALILAFTTAKSINWPYAFSVQVWVSVWLTATFIAYRAAIQRKFKLHKEWMTRSYIVTLAFVVSGSLLKLPAVQRLGDFAEISPTFFWLGWAVPLYIYEMVLACRRKA